MEGFNEGCGLELEIKGWVWITEEREECLLAKGTYEKKLRGLVKPAP